MSKKEFRSNRSQSNVFEITDPFTDEYKDPDFEKAKVFGHSKGFRKYVEIDEATHD